jgi:methyl-accepting chemotaxis protein/methyl-accepting chemotaxis protein-1 (serine sensor receptor)
MITSSRSFRQSFADVVDHRCRQIQLAAKLEADVWGLRASNRGIYAGAFLKNPAAIAAARKAWNECFTDASNVIEQSRALARTEQGRDLLDDLSATLAKTAPLSDEVTRLSEAGEPEQAARIGAEKMTPLFNHAIDVTQQVIARHRKLLEEEKQQVENRTSMSLWLAGSMVAFALIVASGVVVVLLSTNRALRQLSADLWQGSEQVASAASQVSSSAQSLAQGASEQAASLEETSSSTEEISAMTTQNSEAALKAAHLVGQSCQQFAGTKQRLGEMVIAMEEISDTSNQVAKIIKVIDEIAFQTNILALNAAVEAARAGESGMGFAVVADEVRNLAQRCAQAAKDTAVLIETAVSKSAHGTQKVREVEQAIAQATEQALEMKTLVDEVNIGSQEQKKGLDQIARAISQMEQVTQQTAASAEESASAGEELNAQAETLRGSVADLTRLVDGSGAVSEPTLARQQLARHSGPHPDQRRLERQFNFRASPTEKHGWLTDAESGDQFVSHSQR